MSSGEDTVKTIEILKNAARNGKLILVVGCGISSASVPGVNEFMDTFLDFLNEKSGCVYDGVIGRNACNGYRKKIKQKQFEYFLQHVSEIIGDGKLFELLRILYPPKETKGLAKHTTAAHRIIASALLKKKVTVLTTNFDGFIEAAYDSLKEKEEKPLEVIVKDDAYKVQNETNDQNETNGKYYKLHGSTEYCYKDETVATLFVEGAGFSEGKKNFLKKLYKKDENGDKAIWFYGYGLNDYDMMLLLKELAQDNEYHFANLVFNIFGVEKANNMKLLEELFAQNKRDVKIQYTTDMSNYIIEEVLCAPHDEKPCVRYNFSCNEIEKLKIDKTTATLTLAKLLCMVERGDDHNTPDISSPLLELLKNYRNTYIRQCELHHMIAQVVHEKTQKEHHFKKAFDIATNQLKKLERCTYCSKNMHRFLTLNIEAQRMSCILSDDIEKYYQMIKSANELKDSLERNQNKLMKQRFKILYKRCYIARIKYSMRNGIKINSDLANEIDELVDNGNCVGDLDIHATAHYIKYLLNTTEDYKHANEAKFYYQLLGLDIGALASEFIP